MTSGSRVLLAGEASARPAGLERALTRAGFLLTEARPTGGELEPDAVLLTLASADELRAALGAAGASSPPVVVLIAEPDPDAAADALACGADDAVAAPVHLPELCARLHARIRDRQTPRSTVREGVVRRSLETLVGETRAALRPDEVVLALVRRLARAFDLRCCAFVAVEPDGEARLVAAAGQGRVAADEEPLELGDHPEVAEAIRLRRLAGRPDGAVTALPAVIGGRVHGVLELVRCEGGASLTAAQLQFAGSLAEAAAHALEPVVASTNGNGAGPAARPMPAHTTLDQRLQEEFERARRYSLSFSLVLLEVCQGNGAEPGADTVEHLQRGLRMPDYVSSYGSGGEYAIVLPETGGEGARRSVARVREHLAHGRGAGSAEPALSAGIVTYPHPAVTQADDLFALVEAALARGKAQSGERVGVAD